MGPRVLFMLFIFAASGQLPDTVNPPGAALLQLRSPRMFTRELFLLSHHNTPFSLVPIACFADSGIVVVLQATKAVPNY